MFGADIQFDRRFCKTPRRQDCRCNGSCPLRHWADPERYSAVRPSRIAFDSWERLSPYSGTRIPNSGIPYVPARSVTAQPVLWNAKTICCTYHVDSASLLTVKAKTRSDSKCLGSCRVSSV